MEKSSKKKMGRPRKYPEEIARLHNGAPKLGVRLEPDLYEKVKQKGGSPWVRELIQEALAAELPPDPPVKARRKKKAT